MLPTAQKKACETGSVTVVAVLLFFLHFQKKGPVSTRRFAALLGPYEFHEHVCKGWLCSENDALLGKKGTASTVLPLV